MTTGTQTIVRCQQVNLWRGATTILQEVNWRVELGQHWIVLGPNGAGKTSLVDMLAGRMYPSEGRVEILGETLGKVEIAEIRQQVGYASPILASQIPPEEKVQRVVLSAAWSMTASWQESYDPVDLERAAALMSMFRVLELKDRPFFTLSDGEKQRVLVARALMIDPEMLVLDEPAAALDLGGRELLVGGLRELSRDAKSPVMIMVTHHLEEIPYGFTHALAMKNGRVFRSGILPEVLTSEILSEMYEIPLTVECIEGRFTAWLNRS